MAAGKPQSIDFSKPIDKSCLHQKTALITGGSTGIGAGIVKTFAACGAFVFIADINEKDGQDLAATLKEQGHDVAFQQTDVTSYASQLAAFKTCIQKSPHSTVDIVIPCAGIRGGSFDDHAHAKHVAAGADPPEPPTAALQVNLMGVYYTAHLACHYFSAASLSSPDAADDKHLLFISSLAGFVNPPLKTSYATAKAGVRAMWKSIRHSTPVFSPGMRSNLLAPTFIESPMIKDNIENLRKIGWAIADIEDAVQGVLRLCCDPTINGRAMCIAPRRDATEDFGSRNFDMEDHIAAGDGTAALRAEASKGTLGPIVTRRPGVFAVKPQQNSEA